MPSSSQNSGLPRRWWVAPLAFMLLWLLRENYTGGGPTTRSLAVPTSSGVASSTAAAVYPQLLSPPPPPAVSEGTPASAALVEARSSTAGGSGGGGAAPTVTPSASAAAMPAVTLSSPLPPPVCTSLSCAARFQAKEPAWADLKFQPNIDWHAGGVRGDCVAGELEYILPKYCSPGRERLGNFPSESRLNQIDVHSAGKPTALLSEIVQLLPNRTLLLMGDSVMEQFYNALQCYLRKESLLMPNDREYLKWVDSVAPLWRMGKRKKPPKLPERARGGTRFLYARVTSYQPDEVAAAIGTADVVILNWGLHYQAMPTYTADLKQAFTVLNRYASQRGKAILFQETGAQHFKASDARGYSTGEWESRDKTADAYCSCKPIEDFNVNVRNRVLGEVLSTGDYTNIQRVGFYDLTRPRWRWHFGNCTKRPNGWNYYTCCDCTHFCFSPAMWHVHLHAIKQALLSSPGFRPLTGR